MEIIKYQEKYKDDFVKLNTAWLERFYTVEPFDQDMMDRVDELVQNGAKKLSLISCRDLKPAIHIYEKFGFREVPLNKEFWGAEKADIEMEYIVHEQ